MKTHFLSVVLLFSGFLSSCGPSDLECGSATDSETIHSIIADNSAVDQAMKSAIFYSFHDNAVAASQVDHFIVEADTNLESSNRDLEGAIASCKEAFADPLLKRDCELNVNFPAAEVIARLRPYMDKVEKAKEIKSSTVEAFMKQFMAGGTFSIENIRMTSKNAETGAVTCTGEVMGQANGLEPHRIGDMNYKIERTSDGKTYYSILN